MFDVWQMALEKNNGVFNLVAWKHFEFVWETASTLRPVGEKSHSFDLNSCSFFDRNDLDSGNAINRSIQLERSLMW